LAFRKTSGRHGSRLVKPFINLRQSRSFLLKIEVSVAWMIYFNFLGNNAKRS